VPGTLIYARRQALAFYLWDHLSDPIQQGNAYLQLALKSYQITLKDLLADPEAHQEQFNAFLAGELEAVIRHEMGEALEPSLQDAFPAVLQRFPRPGWSSGCAPSKTPWPMSTSGAAWPISSPESACRPWR